MIHRLLNTPLHINEYNDELNIIKHIAIANGYKPNIIDQLIHKHKNKNKNMIHNSNIDTNIKFAAANYTNILPDTLLYEFKKLNINVSFRTNNNIYKFLQNHHHVDTFHSKSGIYKITCNDCDMIYIGQTGRTFLQRYKEHLPTKKNLLKLKSNYAKHIIDNRHKYSDINTNMQVIKFCNKGKYMNAYEEFYIYKQYKENPQILLNDQLKMSSFGG